MLNRITADVLLTRLTDNWTDAVNIGDHFLWIDSSATSTIAKVHATRVSLAGDPWVQIVVHSLITSYHHRPRIGEVLFVRAGDLYVF